MKLNYNKKILLILTSTIVFFIITIPQITFAANNCKVDVCLSPSGKSYCCPFQATMSRFDILDEAESELESGQLECIIYSRDNSISSKFIITYDGPYIREITKDMNLEIWHKQGNLTMYSYDQRVLHDLVKVYFDGISGKGFIPTSFSGFFAAGHLPSRRFDAVKWGYRMSEISCMNSVIN